MSFSSGFQIMNPIPGHVYCSVNQSNQAQQLQAQQLQAQQLQAQQLQSQQLQAQAQSQAQAQAQSQAQQLQAQTPAQVHCTCGSCHTNVPDINTVLNNFCTNYYSDVLSNGWNGTLRLFDESCSCLVNGVTMKPYDMMCELAKTGIHRGNIENPLATCKYWRDDLYVINVTASINLIGFNNNYLSKKVLGDNFVVSLSRGKIVDHVMHLRD